jgi:hypothetical protein
MVFVNNFAPVATATSCIKCEELLELNNKLSYDLRDLMEQRSATEKASTDMYRNKMENLLRLESELVRREQEAVALHEQLLAAKERSRQVEIDATNSANLKDKAINTLLEEMDVLRAQADKLDKAETRIQGLRERLEVLVDARELLKAEEQAHRDSQRKLLAAEKEVIELRRVREQLREYREQYAAACVRIEELSEEVEVKTRECAELAEANAALVSARTSQQQEKKLLADELELRIENSRQETIASTRGVGEALNELNPAFAYELERLRAENFDLETRIRSCGTEAVEDLQKQCEDRASANAVLQRKWFDAKAALDASCAELAGLQEQMTESEATRETLLQHIDQLTAAHLEETRNLSLRWEREKVGLKNEIDHLTTQYEGTVRELQLSKEETNMLQEAVVAMRANVEAADQTTTALEGDIAAMREEHTKELRDREAEMASRIVAVKAEFEQRLISETSAAKESVERLTKREAELGADIEEERIKRRKVEREKKFFEAEVHRHKTQAQSSGTGSSQEVESAAKEMKSMQMELDAAYKELERLRVRNEGAAADGNSASRIRTASQSAASTGAASDLNAKKVEQLTRERRELIAKSLEENKEKLDLSQKLLTAEKELTSLKMKVTKLTLEKERMERKQQVGASQGSDENLVNSTM